MSFRDLVSSVDDTVFDTLADSGRVEGQPLKGMFSAPWLGPKVGRLNTGLREPRFTIRVAEAAGIEPGQVVTIELPAEDGGGDYDLVELEPDGTGLVALLLRMRA